MKHLWLLGFWIGVVAAAQPTGTLVSTSNDVTYLIPRGSPVQYERTGEYDTVRYRGRFALAGRYEYGYVTDDPADDASYGELELTFRISPEAAALLPYWQQRKRPIQDIYIRNPEKFALEVVGPVNLIKLRNHTIKKVSGAVTIDVENFETTIECDHQTSSAEFVSLHGKPERNLASILADEPGC